MPFKKHYLATIGLQPNTYNNQNTAVERIVAIYGSAREGTLRQQTADVRWNEFFDPLRNRFPNVPATQQNCDQFAIDKIATLANLLRHHRKGDFGIAQKMFNLFLKDHWALNLIPAPAQSLLHIPLDR